MSAFAESLHPTMPATSLVRVLEWFAQNRIVSATFPIKTTWFQNDFLCRVLISKIAYFYSLNITGILLKFDRNDVI